MIIYFYYLFAFILGISFGSFFNVLIDRLVRNEDVIYKSSHCEKCKKKLKSIDLVPLVSYIYLKGRCRYCKTKIPFSIFLLEFLCGVLFIQLFKSLLPYTLDIINLPLIIFYFVLFSVCYLIFFTDLKYKLIPSVYIYILFANFIVFYLYDFISNRSHLNYDYIFFGSISGKIYAVLFILVVFLIIHLIARKNSIGEGDLYLFAVLSLYLDLKFTLVMWFFSFLTGGLVGVILILTGTKEMQSKIAFGPFIILGFIIAIILGNNFLNWYISLI